jgi:hypothetical protein
LSAHSSKARTLASIGRWCFRHTVRWVCSGFPKIFSRFDFFRRVIFKVHKATNSSWRVWYTPLNKGLCNGPRYFEVRHRTSLFLIPTVQVPFSGSFVWRFSSFSSMLFYTPDPEFHTIVFSASAHALTDRVDHCSCASPKVWLHVSIAYTSRLQKP